MFATGDYTGAAAVLNNLLAVAPGMDWTTLSGLYGNVEEYTTQLRALEAHCKQKPDDAAAHFVLAYHYLVAGHGDAAAEQLKRVVAAQPGDQVAKRMLAALTPPAESTAAARQAGPTGWLGTGPGRADDRSGRQLAGRAQRRRLRAFDRREQPVHLEGRRPRASRRSPWPARWPPPATPSFCRARTRARWPPRSSRAGRTSSSSLPPAVRRMTKDSNSHGSRRASLKPKGLLRWRVRSTGKCLPCLASVI